MVVICRIMQRRIVLQSAVTVYGDGERGDSECEWECVSVCVWGKEVRECGVDALDWMECLSAYRLSVGCGLVGLALRMGDGGASVGGSLRWPP